jgi:membrane-bound lytic murein transglycosylase MltF
VSPTGHIGWRFQTLPVLLLAGLLLATAPSCNNSEQEESDEKEESAALEPDSMLTVLFPDRSSFTGDLDSLAMYGVVRVLVPYSNTLYFLDGARQRGLIYEYMKGFESYLRKTLRRRTRPMHVVFFPVRRDQLLQFLMNGYGDIAAGGLTVTEERQKLMDFCTPISHSVNEILVSAKRADSLSTLEDLSGREIYVRKSSSYFEHLQILNDAFNQRDLPPVVIREADESLETEDILEMVNAGVIQLTVADDYIAEFWSGVFDSMIVHSEIILNAGGSIAPAVRKDNPKLKEALNGYIAANRVGTLFTNVLLQRYFRDNRWAKDPTTGQDRKRLEQMLPLFRKYGERYDFDYILLTAIAYQESGLMQNRRSHAGAVGVMQIKPSTAGPPPINIKNVHLLENNIHAGVKYLRHIIEIYLSKNEMSKREQMFFAAASYNAGPTRIARLRSKAEAQGYDPNYWFDNVEVIAAREIGQETVQYVANILKYYIAYRMFVDRSKERTKAIETSKQSDN